MYVALERKRPATIGLRLDDVDRDRFLQDLWYKFHTLLEAPGFEAATSVRGTMLPASGF